MAKSTFSADGWGWATRVCLQVWSWPSLQLGSEPQGTKGLPRWRQVAASGCKYSQANSVVSQVKMLRSQKDLKKGREGTSCIDLKFWQNLCLPYSSRNIILYAHLRLWEHDRTSVLSVCPDPPAGA